MGSSKEELEHLDINLKKVEEKFLCQWTGDSFLKARIDDVENHKNSLIKSTENIKNLEDTINQYHIQSEKNLGVLRERAEEVANLERELRGLQLTAERLLERKNETRKHFEETDSRVHKQREDISAEDERTSYKIRQFTKGTEYFKDRLGLTFKKVDEDHLQFVYKYIDPTDWEKPFVFTVAISEEGKYNVKDCIPEVEELAELVTQLNTTNNFSKFVITIRKKFENLVETTS